MKKTVIAATFAVPLLLASVAVSAFGGPQQGHHGGRQGECGMGDRQMMHQLELTEAQQEEMKEIRETFREQRSERGDRAQERRDHRAEIQSLVLAADFDEAKAQELVAQMTAHHQERQITMLKLRHEMMNVLTDEQKSEYVTLQADKREECAQALEQRADRMRAQ